MPQQVDRLEQILPTCRALLSKPETLTKVRDKLTGIAKGLRRAYRSARAQSEARIRLEIAAADTDADPLSEPDILTRMRRVAEVAESALRALPREQRRANVATPLPIERIERALLKGFIDHHQPAALPAYSLLTSVSKPPFPEIAAIVYEAIGKNGEPPERAIRAYLRLKKKPRKHSHARLKPATAGIEADGPFCLIR